MKKSESNVESMSDQDLCDAVSKMATLLSGHGRELLGELIARWQAAERILTHKPGAVRERHTQSEIAGEDVRTEREV